MGSESEVENTVLLLRYLTAAGLVTMLYDHLLTIRAEVRVVWANHGARSLSKIAFGINVT
ncbi:hypothetical protein B0H10DRAFT_2235145 [Mycena sp. CBHHK59/15]|nr:hypothetical protein B0H10DRAFT_2235145 [Mycena sp. CBHHK59/15]